MKTEVTHGPLRTITHQADRALTHDIIKGASDDELRGAQAIFQHWADLIHLELKLRSKRSRGGGT